MEFFEKKKRKITHQEQESIKKKQKIKKQKTGIKYVQENQSQFLKETNNTLTKLFKRKRETQINNIRNVAKSDA